MPTPRRRSSAWSRPAPTAISRASMCCRGPPSSRDKAHLDEENTIAAFLHAAQLGIFELSWDVLCPTCRGVLDAHDPRCRMRRTSPMTARCAAVPFEVSLDERVEIVFTVSRACARSLCIIPGRCRSGIITATCSGVPPSISPTTDYKKLDFRLHAVQRPSLTRRKPPPSPSKCPRDQVPIRSGVALRALSEIAPGAHREFAEGLLAFEGTERANPAPTTQSGFWKRVELTLATLHHHAGRCRWSGLRPKKHHVLGRPAPAASDREAHLHQPDVSRALSHRHTAVDQGLKVVVKLTFLFTDLKGSTELYARVGDLVAYELVRGHFRLLTEIVAAERGAVVKPSATR